MNIDEWKRLVGEWESAQLALSSLQEDINAEVQLYLKGEGLGPTMPMKETLLTLRNETQELLSALDSVIFNLPSKICEGQGEE